MFGNIRTRVSNVFSAISGFWTNTLQPVFEAIKTFVVETLWPPIRDTFGNIRS